QYTVGSKTRTIEPNVLIAISTPAQKPRGDARSTCSTATRPGYKGVARTLVGMALPLVVAVAPASAAARGGIEPGDEILELNGRRPRDVIEWQLAVDEPEVELLVHRGGLQLDLRVEKGAGEPFGVEVGTALFDQVRT